MITYPADLTRAQISYARKREEIDALLQSFRDRLDEHGIRSNQDPRNWNYSQDLDLPISVLKSLIDVM